MILVDLIDFDFIGSNKYHDKLIIEYAQDETIDVTVNAVGDPTIKMIMISLDRILFAFNNIGIIC
jgi:hypothetical protein